MGKTAKKIPFDNISDKYIATPEELEDFFRDITNVFKKYNLSISH